ncbi:MAG: PD-(D/E)XK nuclease family protein [Clostridia bacterium]|nr:PD-(D/E)XK nuclease family protein [Clostridia bacterium]
MLTLLFGAPGTGKTTMLFEAIASDIAAGIPSFLVVPEQNTVSVEATAARRLPPNAPLVFEVTNFTRLADTVFRRVGGVAARYADEATSALLLRDVLAALAPALSDRRRVDAARVGELLGAIREFKMSAIRPDMLAKAAEEVSDNEPLSHKLADLSLLLAGFEDSLSSHGTLLPIDGLARLGEILATEAPLAGAHFYFDGFTSFTAVQRAVMRGLLRTGELTVTLPMPPPELAKAALSYAEVERTVRDLTRLGDELGVEVKRLTLTENRRARAPILAEIGNRLFTVAPPPLPERREEDAEAIRILECRTPYSEAEIVAADIARRVQEGARYRDFAIVARSAEEYRGVLDTALARHGIPAYFSLPTDLSAFEAIKMIRTVYAILTGGERREDVITYLKCGLLGLTRDESDRFELYAERWGLSGRRLLHVPFRMLPGGYSPPKRAEDRKAAEEALASLNATQAAIRNSLRIPERACKENVTVKEHCAILYEYLTEMQVDKKLYERAKEYAAAGDAERADEVARLFATITETLDRLVELIPDSVLSAADFSDLLSLVFSTKTLRAIPARADAVTVGSADLLRPNEPRHVYLIGVGADVFPRGGEENGIFTQTELSRLCDLGIVLDGDELVRASREYYCFLRALLAATESVTLSYYLVGFSFTPVGRSDAIDRILAMDPDRFPIRREDEMPLFDRLFSTDAAIAALGSHLTAAEREALLTVLNKDAEAAPLLASAIRPLTDPQARVDREVMDTLYRDRIALTQSHIDRYVSCPFSYFCKYVLKLSDDSHITLHSGEIGTFIHAVLEYFFRDTPKEVLAKMSDAEIADAVSRLTDRYLSDIFPEESELTPRIRHRFARLGAAAVRIVRELREEAAVSEFVPLFFEYSPSDEDPEAAAPRRILLEDGRHVTLYGSIDRVDVYHHGGNAYLRVIDYKTGAKEFAREDIRQGKNLQMLIYLFSLWKTDREGFARALGVAEGGGILPAGALYLNLSLALSRVAHPTAPPDGRCTRSGLLLAATESLHAMDPTESGRFIPLTFSEDGTPTVKKAVTLADGEEMEELCREVDDIIRTLSGRMVRGEADALPLLSGKSSPCAHCDYYPICRNAGGGATAEG